MTVVSERIPHCVWRLPTVFLRFLKVEEIRERLRYIWSLFVKRKLPNHLLPNEQGESKEMKVQSYQIQKYAYGYRFTQRVNTIQMYPLLIKYLTP